MCCLTKSIFFNIIIYIILGYCWLKANYMFSCSSLTKCKSVENWYNCEYQTIINEINDDITCEKQCSDMIEHLSPIDCEHRLRNKVRGKCYDEYLRSCEVICSHNLNNHIVYNLTIGKIKKQHTENIDVSDPDKISTELDSGHGIIKDINDQIIKFKEDKTVNSYFNELNKYYYRNLTMLIPFNMLLFAIGGTLIVYYIIICGRLDDYF